MYVKKRTLIYPLYQRNRIGGFRNSMEPILNGFDKQKVELDACCLSVTSKHFKVLVLQKFKFGTYYSSFFEHSSEHDNSIWPIHFPTRCADQLFSILDTENDVPINCFRYCYFYLILSRPFLSSNQVGFLFWSSFLCFRHFECKKNENRGN